MKEIYKHFNLIFTAKRTKTSFVSVGIAFLIILWMGDVKAQCTPSPAFGGTSNGAAGNIYITTAKFNSTTFYSGGTAGANPYTNLYSTVNGNVTAGQTYTFNMSSFAASSGSYYTCFYAWIDWNNNNIFTDAGENIMGITVANGGSWNVTSPSFTVGAGLSGNVRMRIAVMGGGFGSIPAIAPCAGQSLYYGEFKDFKVTITPGTPCAGTPASLVVAPSSTSICSPATTTIALTLDAAGYTYQWQESSASGGPYANVTGGSGATTATFTTPTGATLPFSTTYYRCNVTCTASGQTTPSQISTISLSSFLNCYCLPTFAAANGGTRGITQVILNGSPTALNNTSTVNSTSPYYTLYTTPVADLALSGSYTLQVKVGSQAAANHRAGAWIDYNQNGVFETTEFIGAFASAVAANATGSIAFSVPGTALTGTTAMRVIGRFGTTNTIANNQACASFTGTAAAGGAGEVEDYRINISGSACSGTPTAGNVYAGSSGTNTTSSACASTTTTMYATGYTSGVSGISLQWQVATAAAGPYANVVGGSGATTANYTTAALSNPGLTALHYYYKCLITCTNGGATAIQTTPLDVTVNPTPSVSINGSAPYSTSICNTGSPNSVVLTGSNAASGTTTWSWSPATGLSATNVANPTANPTSTTTYTLTATANTCAGNTTATVTVNPTSVVATATPSTISLGQSSALTAISSSTNGALTYNWSPATSLFVDAGLTTPYNLGDNVQNVYTSTLSTAVYTVTATDPSGCSNTGTVTVSVSSGSPGTVSCGYSYSYGPTGSYATAASLGTPTSLTWADDQVYTNKNIGFTFNFNDAPYSTMGISSNGFIWFGTGTCAATQYTPLSSTSGQTGNVDGIISVYGTDMGSFIGASLKYVTYGTAGSRICVIEWASVGVDKVGVGSPGAQSDFQIRLYEGTNKIEFFYRCAPYDLTFVGSSGVFSAQTGIRAAVTSDYLNRTNGCEGSWASTTAGATNTAGMSLAGGWNCASSWPVTGRIFVYTPTTKPTITPTGQQNICTGGSVVLTAVNSGGMSSPTYQWQTYTWPTSNTNIGGQTSSTYTANPGSAGNYFYTVKLTSGTCSRNSDAVAVVVASCNTITTTNVATQICAGSALSVNYTASGSFTGGNIFTAQLSDATGSFASPTTIGTVASTASGSISCTIPSNTPTGINYQIRVISSNPSLTGSPNTAFEILEPAPTITVTNPSAGCAPGTVDITASGIVNVTNGVTVSGITYWDDAGASVAYSGSPSAVVSASTIYVKYTNSCGSDVEPIIVTYNNPLIISNSKTNPSTCAGSNGTITLNGLLPSTSYTVVYQKNGPPNVNAGTISTNAGGSLIISGLSDGAYDSFVVTRLGCSSALYPVSPTTITLNDPTPPTVSGYSSLNPTSCSSSDGGITLTGLLASTTYNLTYDKNSSTTNAGSLTTDAGGNLNIINLGDGIYENLYVTLAGCNSSPVPNSGSIVLSPPSSPVISSATTADPSTCNGTDGNIQLSGLAASASYTVNYFKNSSPINGGSIVTNGSGVLTINGLTQGVYTSFVVTSALGCFSNTYPASGSITLTDPPQPVISSYIANDPGTCGGNGSIQLSGLLTSTAYNVTYKKNGGSTINAGSISTNGSGQLLVTSISAGDYDNIIVSINGCSSDPYPVSGSITLTNPPIPSDAVGLSASICGANSLILDASGAGVGEDYKWYDALTGGSLLQSSGSTYVTPVISSSTDYYVTIYNVTTGCESSTRVEATATIYNKPIATISGSLTGCSTSGIVLGSVGSAAGSGTISSYQWQVGGVAIPLATLSSLPVFTSGNYTLIVSNTNGCSTTSSISNVNISLAPLASGTGTLNTCENSPITITNVSASNGSINWSVVTGNGSIINANTINPTYIPAGSDAGTTVVLRMTVSNSPCADEVWMQLITIDPRPILSMTTVNICGGNPTQEVSVISPQPNTDYKWTPATDLYLDAGLTTPYVAGTSATSLWIAPFGSTTYNVTATNTLSGCTTNPTAVNVIVCPAATNDICQADAVAPINVTSTAVFNSYNLIGATPSIFASCAPIQRDIYYRVIVPANGELHIITAPGTNTTAALNVQSTVVSILTGASCGTANSIACNSNGAAGNMSYAHASGLTPGSTAYIRMASTVANNNPTAQFVRMAVTTGLVWTAAVNDDFNNPANWHGGDATALTVPDATISAIIPHTVTKPKLYANSTVRGMSFTSGTPYFISPGLTLNGFTLNVKGNWFVGPSTSSSLVLDCNGLVEFNGNGTSAQTIGGKTTFGNLNTNNTTSGINLTNATAVTCILKTLAGNFNSAGYLTLRSTPTITALVDPSAGNVLGNVNVERKIGNVSGYHYLSSPVANSFVNNSTIGWRDDFTILSALDGIAFVPGTVYSQLPTVWEYDETNLNPNTAYGWVATTGTNDALTPLKGFACVVSANTLVDAVGPLNNGTIPGGYTVTKTAGTGAGEGLNAIGNPYASPISWNAFRALSGNNTLLSTSGYQAFIATGGYAGTYGSWDGTVGSPVSVTDKIASSQGIMITALAAGSINANNSVRLTTASDLGSTFFNGYNSVPNLMRLEVLGNGFANETAIYFDPTAVDAFDIHRDARLIYTPTQGVPNLYSYIDNTPLNINVMGHLNMDKVIPLGLKIQSAGTYSLVATDMSSFAPSVIAYLEDTQTGTMTNLRTNPSYTLTLAEGEINNRFFLHFHPAVEFNTVGETCAGNDGKLMINYPTTNTVNIVIKDESGNVVVAQNNVSGSVAINNLVAGNYVAEMTFGIAPNTYTTSDYFTVAGGNAVFANLSASANSVDMNANTTVNFTATAQGATSFNWNFGDGTVVTNGPANMSHTFAQAGTYHVTFEASNGICNTTATTTVEVTNATGLTAIANSNLQVLGLGSKVVVRFGNKMEGTGNIEIINMLGEVVAHLDNVSMKGTREIEMSNIAAGQYMVKITNNNKLFTEKVYLSRQ
jgi:hypothetical protein